MKLKLNTKLSETKDGLYAYSLVMEALPPDPEPDDSTDSTDSTDYSDIDWDNYDWNMGARCRPHPDDSADSNDAWDWNIFVFRRSTPTMNPYGRTDMVVDDEFFNVATPVDMYDIPAKFPDIEHNMPYFRDSKVELWFRNLEDALRAKREIEEDVASLCRLWDNLNDESTFKLVETRTYGEH